MMGQALLQIFSHSLQETVEGIRVGDKKTGSLITCSAVSGADPSGDLTLEYRCSMVSPPASPLQGELPQG